MSRFGGPHSTAERRAVPPDVQAELAGLLLKNPVRRGVIDALTAKPGSNKNQIRKTLGLALNVIDAHMARLEEAGLVHKVQSASMSKEDLYFSDDDRRLSENERTRILYGRGETRRIAMYVAAHPGATTAAMARATRTRRQGVAWHLRKLKEHYLVGEARTGPRSVEYHPLEDLRRWYDAVGARFADEL